MTAPIRIAIVVAGVGVSYFPAKYAVDKFHYTPPPSHYHFSDYNNPLLGGSLMTGTDWSLDPALSGTDLISGTRFSSTHYGGVHWQDLLPSMTSGTIATGTGLSQLPALTGTGQQGSMPWDPVFMQPLQTGTPASDPYLTPNAGNTQSGTDISSKMAGRDMNKDKDK